MSHTPHETIVCPNCGSVAEKNYCSECGQETHLHNDSFWGLVMHFIGHYFHYDSKFWKTLRALWFSPGKLTAAYWKKQRMRYIQPVSLYIFISAVFFIFLSFKSTTYEIKNSKPLSGVEIKKKKQADSLAKFKIDSIISGDRRVNNANEISPAERKALSKMRTKIDEMDNDNNSGIKHLEMFLHTFPKIFFFLIPLMSVFLKIMLGRRRELMFVHHAIFSLHFHSFSFSLFLLTLLPFIGNWLIIPALAGIIVYLILSLRNVYQIRWIKAIFYSSVLLIAYVIFAMLAIIIDLYILFAM